MKELSLYFMEIPLQLRDVLIFFIWLFMISSVVQLAFLILHKAVLERSDKKFKLKKMMYFSSLTKRFSQDGQHIDSPKGSIETNALIDVCVDIMNGASRTNVEIIHETVRGFSIPGFLVDNFKKNIFWIKHYQIIETLGFLKLPELAPLYRDIIDKERELLEKKGISTKQKADSWLSDVRNPATRHLHLISKALWALSHICADVDFPRIIVVLQTPGFMSGKFNEYIFCNIIDAYRRRDEVEPFLATIEKLFADDSVPLLIKRDFIQACGTADFIEGHTVVAQATDLFAGSAEMKMACIRTLSQIGDERLEELMQRYLADSDWRVRAVAAKDARKCSDAIIPALRNVLCDSSYYVRLNAALSLARKGTAGKAVLKECVEGTDKFGKDMASYALDQG